MTAPLVRGANAPLRGASRQPVPRVLVEVAWTASSPGQDVVLLAVACDARGQALSPAHQSTFRSPTTAGTGSRFELLMDLHAVPDDCPHVAFALSTDGSTIRHLDGLTVTVRTEQGEELARYLVDDIPDWPGLIVAEIYRRSDQWKFRAIGQGLSEGYNGLLRSFALVA
jgi:stress response protein SCP2